METKLAKDFYEGYSTRTVLGQGDKYIHFESEFTLLWDFQGKDDWGKVVDFGGGVGQKTRLIKNVTVVESDEGALEFMNKNGILCAPTLDSFEDGSIDLIYCSGVLEHLERPFDYLLQFKRKLVRGGRLILSQPMDKPVFETLKDEDNGHVYTWTAPQLNLLLKRAGFNVISNTTECSVGFPFLSRFLNKNMAYWKLQKTFLSSKAGRMLAYIYISIFCAAKEIAQIIIGKYYIVTLGVMKVVAKAD